VAIRIARIERRSVSSLLSVGSNLERPFEVGFSTLLISEILVESQMNL